MPENFITLYSTLCYLLELTLGSYVVTISKHCQLKKYTKLCRNFTYNIHPIQTITNHTHIVQEQEKSVPNTVDISD